MKNQEFSLKLSSWIVVLVFMLTIWGIAGCSSAPKRVRIAQESIQEAFEAQKPIQVKTSEEDSRPDWTKKTVFEDEGKVFFSGGFLNGSDYSVTIRCANAEALKNAVQAISLYIRAEFSQYVQGSNAADGAGIERYVEDGIATFAENIHVQGIKQVQVYTSYCTSFGES